MSVRPLFRIGWRRWPFATSLALGLVVFTAMAASAANTWSTLPSMPTARSDLGAAAAPCPFSSLHCVYSVGGEAADSTALNTLESWNHVTNNWSTLPPMPTARGEVGVAAALCPPGQSGTCVYASGGITTAGTALKTFEAYRPATNTWSTLPSMPTARGDTGTAAAPCPQGSIAGGCVYVAGGDVADSGVALSTFETYSRWTGTWSTLPPMPTARFRLAAAAGPCPVGQSGTCVYALGGNTGAGNVSTVEAYSQVRNTWSTLPGMPTARRDLAAAAAPCPAGAAGTCIYAIGGDTRGVLLNTVEVYNPANNTWSTVAPMPTTRDELGATAAPCLSGSGTCVYAVGGETAANASLNTFEAYKP